MLDARSAAFLTGRVKYTDPVSLLSGPISVFHEQDYVGDSVLTEVSNAEPFTVHLGANEDIQINRSAERFRETAGLLSKSYVYKNKITIKVHNRKREAVTVDVFDRVPVSADERVRISDLQMQPTPAAQKSEAGLLRFRLNLRAGAEQTITIQYNLSHPEGILPQFNESDSPRW